MHTLTSKDGQLELLTLNSCYISDPTTLYSTLCEKQKASLLLESSEISSKQNLKSLMLIDPAVRIHCLDETVTIEALTHNGIELLNTLTQSLPSNLMSSSTSQQLTLTFPKIEQDLDEDTKLSQLSSFDALRFIQQQFDVSNLPSNALFIGGLFAYDLVANFETLTETQTTNLCPDYLFYVAESLLVIDHQTQTSTLQGTLFTQNSDIKQSLIQRLESLHQMCSQSHVMPIASRLKECQAIPNISDEHFNNIVANLKSNVIEGDVFQVVPSRRFSLPCPSPLHAYCELKISNPSPYMFYLQDLDFTLFGASPESALKYERTSNQVEIYPIAGTRQRGKRSDGSINHDLDSRIELELRRDKKENAEHMMLVDLARNDVARISQPGTRHVAELLKVDRYSHVMHLVSRVIGQLKPELDALHAYQASMNMGTLTGAPKVRAMQLISQVEKERRGSYGGAIGYLTGNGNMDTCIVIRSAYVENEVAHVQAGAGVVFDSIPEAETEETRSKAQAVISAIQKAHLFDMPMDSSGNINPTIKETH